MAHRGQRAKGSSASANPAEYLRPTTVRTSRGFGARQQDKVVTWFLERDAAVKTRFTGTVGSSTRSLTNRAMQWFVLVVVVAVAAGTGVGTAASAAPATPDSAAGPSHSRLPETAA